MIYILISLIRIIIIMHCSIRDIIYLIYAEGCSISFYNLIDNLIMCKIKKPHNKHIVKFRHYFDKNNKRDLILLLSHEDCIKLWDINKFECLLTFKFDNTKKSQYDFYSEHYHYYSMCFLKDDNQIYISAAIGYLSFINDSLNNRKKIRILELNGKIKK